MASFKMRFVLLGAIFLIFIGTGFGQQAKVGPKGPLQPQRKKPVAAVPPKKSPKPAPGRRPVAPRRPKEEHVLQFGEKIRGDVLKDKALFMKASEAERGKHRKAAVLHKSVMGGRAQEETGIKVEGPLAKVLVQLGGLSEPFDKMRNVSKTAL